MAGRLIYNDTKSHEHMLNENEFQMATEWCNNVAEMVRQSIISKGVVDTGTLLKSVECYPEAQEDGTINIVFAMFNYGYFQDEGVKGANPSGMPNGGIQKAPFSKFTFGSGNGGGSLNKSLDGWIVRKGIAPRGAKGQFMSRKGLKYVMSRSIYLQGLPPRKFFAPIWEEQTKALQPMLEQGLIKDIETQWYELITKQHANRTTGR